MDLLYVMFNWTLGSDYLSHMKNVAQSQQDNVWNTPPAAIPFTFSTLGLLKITDIYSSRKVNIIILLEELFVHLFVLLLKWNVWHAHTRQTFSYCILTWAQFDILPGDWQEKLRFHFHPLWKLSGKCQNFSAGLKAALVTLDELNALIAHSLWY